MPQVLFPSYRTISSVNDDSVFPPFIVPYSGETQLESGNICGATLIGAYFALVAAHCLTRGTSDDAQVLIGSYAKWEEKITSSTEAKSCFVHEEYNEETRENDIALIKIGHESSTIINDQSLPKLPDDNTNLTGNATLMKWIQNGVPGMDVSEYSLKKCNVSIIALEQCSHKLGKSVGTKQLCVKPSDFKNELYLEDLGGHLICSGSNSTHVYLCGIFSLAIGSTSGSDYLLVFTRISSYYDWIHNNMRSTKCDDPTNDCLGGFHETDYKFEDESNCETSQFFCHGSRNCILMEQVCDGYDDCGLSDTSDEDNCKGQNGCHSTQFPCRSGNKCIPKIKMCNKYPDCYDASDEEACPELESPNCDSQNEFHCKVSKRCIPLAMICDGFKNCGYNDSSDEENCRDVKDCHPLQFSCRLGNQCVPGNVLCDENEDCPDGSDEDYCSVGQSPCNSSQFQCNQTRKCIALDKICDGLNSCGGADESDEEGCREVDGCHRTQFPCRTGNKCIVGQRKCDNVYDCDDASDEMNCLFSPKSNCSSDEFLCFGSKKCIPLSMVCDGILNCSGNDTSDETHCRSQNGCHPTQFACHKGNECIPGHERCDKVLHCTDESDELNCQLPLSSCPRNRPYPCNASSPTGNCFTLEQICDDNNDCAEDNGMPSDFLSPDEENCQPGISGCAWNQFACPGSSTCISALSICDGNRDCEYGSDEVSCSSPDGCHWTQFHCRKDSQCRPKAFICDGNDDCSDGSDELNCPRTGCTPLQFTCEMDQTCIPGYFKCDGNKDCVDGSDEENCQAKTNFCGKNELPCNFTRKCFGLKETCDGRKDCGRTDSTDEGNCTVGLNGCFWTQFACPQERTCIQGILKCDGKKDCTDGSDEENCEDGSGCHWTQFVCQSDRKCIRSDYKCDGKEDCKDGSDEESCGPGECFWTTFQCLESHECLPGQVRCDGKEDCSDGSDEIDCSHFVTKGGSATMQIIYVTVSSGVVVVLVVALTFIVRKYHKQKDQLSDMEIQLFEQGDEKLLRLNGFAHENAEFTPYNRDFEISWKNLNFSEDNKIGEGAYGIVYKGHLESNKEEAIAIKTVRGNVDRSILKALLTELKIMIYLERHENVVELLGACTEFLREGRIYIVVEYCPMGSLLSYLRGLEQGSSANACSRNADEEYVVPSGVVQPIEVKEYLLRKDMMRWSIQIANAMQYLEFKKVIHGDLATRNVLVYSKDLVKITDFGLSRQLVNYDNYVKKTQERLPWRWLALETLKSFAFSHKSDVWSYGITLWEIFSMGQTPYPGMTWNADLVDYLEKGNRLSKPKYTSEEIFNVMSSCWHPEPEDRPDFHELSEMLQRILP